MRSLAARPLIDRDDGPFLAKGMVPGEVHLDLLREGMIPDPNRGLGSVAARWVDDTRWWYHRDVDLTSAQVGRRAWLCFERLDLVARIHVNGVLIGEHRNAFRPFRAEVSEHLRAGSNHLAVELEAWSGGIDKNEVLLDREADWNRHKRPWNRKPAYQWGWDWSSRYLNVGIEGDASLLLTNADLIVDRAVPLVELSADLATATVRARIEITNVADTTVRATIRARVSDVEVEEVVELPAGAHVPEVVLTVPDPQLWWPNGQGDQTLHELAISVSARELQAQRTSRIGFRRISIDRQAHPDSGEYFLLNVNNRPIFCKGANTAPLDTIPNRVDRARYEVLISRALESNFNFLRVNGVGVYESDDFYELCDDAGILVWQDFAFSCSWYPAHDQGFLEEVQAEVTHQVRRIASHASLAVWCGQNESEWLFRDPDNRPTILTDYSMFHLLIPAVLASEDPFTYYAPCSPHSPGSVNYPNDDLRGDQHPWHVGMGNPDIRDYRHSVARFATEGGVLGPGALTTLEGIVEDHGHPLDSVGWHTHDNWIARPTADRSAVPNQTVRFLFGREPGEMRLDEYVYWGGLAQSEGLREYVDNYRRRWPDSGAAVYWAFNDSWPTTRSWTTVDYYLRRTPGFWAVRRAMAPVNVVLALVDERILVFGVNDTPTEVAANLNAGFFGTRGGEISDTSFVTLPPNAATVLRDLGPWQGDPTSSVPFAVLHRAGEVDVRNRLIGPLFHELDLAAAPTIDVRVADGFATFSSDVFVLGLCLDLAGEVPLADNMFDLFPDQQYSIPWPMLEPPQVLFTANLGASAPGERSDDNRQ